MARLTARRDMKVRAPAMSVPREAGCGHSRSRTTASTWRRPRLGGMYLSIRSVNRIAPTRSLLRMAAKASTADTSAAISVFVRSPLPNRPDPETSTSSMSVSSRSSTKRLTKGAPVRAVTFQSIVLTSSPGTYSRTSANSMPRPLKTLWYSPPIPWLTSRLVRISIRLTALRRLSEISGMAASALRHRYGVEDAPYDLLGGDFLGLGLVGEDDPVAHDVRTDRLDVLGGHVAASPHERVCLGGH